MNENMLVEYQQLQSDGPIDLVAFLSSRPQSSMAARLQVILHDLQVRWRSSQPWKTEDYLKRFPEFANDPEAIVALVKTERKAQFGIDTTPEISELVQRFPHLTSHLLEQMQTVDSKLPDSNESPRPIESPDLSVTVSCNPNSSSDEMLVSRYRIGRLLGQGAFGRVYLAVDIELERQVAIKVPQPERFQGSVDADNYLAEARTVAKLNHPNIVPVYDMGRTPEGAVFVVSRYIEGTTLEEKLKSNRPPVIDIVSLLMTVAEALHYAHGQRLIHRDVKPANILIEESTGTPFVADFGLAIREEDYAKQVGFAGTPTYMSPEQARGEAHRLDGRSDVFAIGVILYETLTGQRPFRGSTVNELLHQIVSVEPQAPRSLSDDIPAELERICLKALNKRASDRYASAAALAEDFAVWLQPKANQPVQSHREEQIVPKGLRSFDASDASYFLDLLPGPRNRDGLPESIAFWKQRVEQTDPEQTFSVGLIYGPSGCGKSSLVKAGLIPHLDKDIVAVYVEATSEDTEARILRGLRKRLPDLSEQLGLVDTLAVLRRAQKRKIVIIIDQFEQWLHAHRTESDAVLIAALRQCDGGRLQAIVMIRDDFAMAAARFMNSLDVPILQGVNFATVDLFDVDHAEKVITRFGQAFGKLPVNSSNLSPEDQQFVRDVSQGLARDGKVVSVRLSLFAEMVKGKPWTPSTLQQVGGTDGIGVNFLEETFSSPQANPRHRFNSAAARSVLNALLPELGTDIKGHMRSQAELLDLSGYKDRPHDFNDLLRILDGELRLITPTDPEGREDSQRRTIVPNRSETDKQLGQFFDTGATRHFQLTHDYLVPSLREWLTRKQKETKRGRAELKLAERASAWNTKPEDKQLPTALEWLNIRRLTEKNRWTDPQREMMSRATRVHSLRAAMAIASMLAFLSVGFIVRQQVLLRQETTRIEGLVKQLVSADPNQIPSIVKQLDANHSLANSYLLPLVSADAKSANEQRARLHAQLATISYDKSLVESLLEELFTNKVAYIAPIREQLRPYAGELTEKLRAILRDEKADANRRFRAATALADFVPESESASWTDADLQFVTGQLLLANSEFQPLWRENLRPISKQLLPDLEKIFGDSKSTDAQRLSAANAFADYASEDFPRLSRLIVVASPEQYAVLYPLIASARDSQLKAGLLETSKESPNDDLPLSERVALGKRRAGAAITLLRQGERETILDALRFTNDPEALSQFVARCRKRGVTAVELLECLDVCDAGRIKAFGKARTTEDRVLFGLILALGDYSFEELPESVKPKITERLVNLYASDPSSTIHGATGWLLRRWNKEAEVTRINETPIPYDPTGARDWYVLKINVDESSKGEEPSDAETKDLYFTMIVFRAGEYTIGSPENEPDRQGCENQHRVILSRPIAVCDQELTWRNYDPIDQGETRLTWQKQFGRTLAATDPAFGVNWFEAIWYCRWLSTMSGIEESQQCFENPENLPKDDKGNVKFDKLDLSGKGFRLPTESEWEVICRSETQTAYSFGNDVNLLGDYGWYSENSNKWLHPVGQLRPSIRGLFDLHGNLYEWCHDRYDDYIIDSVYEDPVGSFRGSDRSDRVDRGGSWNGDAANCRTAYRNSDDPTFRATFFGFRVALSPSEKLEEGKEK